MAIKSYRELVRSAKETDTYWIESAKHDFAFGLHRQLKQLGITNKDLAQKLNVSAPYISKVMRGEENLTIESMVKLARAVRARLHLEVEQEAQGLQWVAVLKKFHHAPANVGGWPKDAGQNVTVTTADSSARLLEAA